LLHCFSPRLSENASLFFGFEIMVSHLPRQVRMRADAWNHDRWFLSNFPLLVPRKPLKTAKNGRFQVGPIKKPVEIGHFRLTLPSKSRIVSLGSVD
jgi:hypothetical protein